MKLISKTIFYYLFISLPLILIAGLCSYYLISNELRDGVDEALWKEKLSAEKRINSLKTPQIIYLSSDSLSSISLVDNNESGYAFLETTYYDKFEGEYLNYRILRSYYKSINQNYLLVVAKPTLEEDELLEGLFSTFALIIAFLLFAFFVVNWLLSKTLWKPFYKTLTQLNQYDIKNHSLARFELSSTKEFSQLNDSLNKMTDKIYADYLQQKEFTENASHEMQTPLAVIKANLSLLMQSSNIKEEEMNQLEAIDNTVKKLSSLNKALILLSKIENHQFNENISVSINDKLKSIIHHYQDLLQNKNLTIETEFENNLIVTCNSTLADVLLTNLLQNAIRHNHRDGAIYISIKGNTLIMSNTGKKLSVAEDELFVRFKKNDASKESLGLGLSIVKSIASIYSININYNYTSNKHTFTLIF